MIRKLGHCFFVSEDTLGITGPSLILNYQGNAVLIHLGPDQAAFIDNLTEGSYPMHSNWPTAKFIPAEKVPLDLLHIYSTGRPKPPPEHKPSARRDHLLVKSPPRPLPDAILGDLTLADLGLD